MLGLAIIGIGSVLASRPFTPRPSRYIHRPCPRVSAFHKNIWVKVDPGNAMAKTFRHHFNGRMHHQEHVAF